MGASYTPKNTATATAAATPPTLAESIPGLNNMSSAASGNILNLLSGNASPSLARTTNAYWGVGAGQPATSDINSFIGQRGTDLYGQQAQANQQTGLQDLLSMIQGYSGNVGLGAGQQQQGQQFTQSQAQQAGQFAASLAQQAAQSAQQDKQFNQSLGENTRQFDQSQGQQNNQFNMTNSLNQFQAQINALLGFGNMNSQNPFAF